MKRKLLILSSIFLISAIAIGAELQSFYKAKFSGLNTTVNQRLLQDDEAFDISNFSLDEVGSIKERDLFGQYNSVSGALGSNFITGLFKHYTSDSKFFFACAGTKIGLGSAGAFTDITPSNSSVIAGYYYSGISFNNRFYLYNPKDEPFVYTGNGSFHKLGNATAIPGSNCAYSAVHKARAWAARSDLYPYRLYYSSLNNAEDWVTTGGYIDLPDINQEIKGIISWGGYLYIFTETNIYILLGSTPNDFSLRKTNSMVGAIAPRSIKITDIGICFVSRSGVYSFDGNNSNKISTKIEGTISGISKTLIQNACAIYDGRKYWLAYTPTGSSYNSKIIIYDIYLKDWTIYQGDGCNISYFERAYGGTDKGELYGGSSISNGIVWLLQSSAGTESFTHSTQTDFNDGITFNTIVTNTPSVELIKGNNPQTKLLAHLNGNNGATAYTSEDDNKRTITFNGGAQLSNAQKKFGVTSCIFDGAGDYLSIADSPDWDFGTEDFTIDFQVRFAVVGAAYFISRDAAGTFDIRYGADGNFYFTIENANAVVASWSPVADTWYHIACVRKSGSAYVFIDGVQLGSTGSNSSDVQGTTALEIGRLFSGAGYLNGWMDEIRMVKGIGYWNSNFNAPTAEYGEATYEGTFTSNNLQINSAGISSLDKITWVATLPTNTKIAFQTRTGATSDSVYFNGWQYWSSANSVTLSTVTDATAIFTSSTNDGSFTVKKPYYAQTRNVLYYEDEDSISPNAVSINTVGAASTNKYIEAFISSTNLSDYDWLSGWYKSPASGHSVEFYIGEGRATNHSITFNTVNINTWEKWYWYIGGITASEKDDITYIKYKYRGDVAGGLVFAEVEARNFYDTDDTMTSTPNDWIQYRGIFGTTDTAQTPQLSSITLTYTPGSTTPETSLSSYYYTKWFDFKTPQLNKQFDSLVLEVNTTTASTVTGSSALCTINCDYDIDFGTKTGTLSFLPTTTANTIRLLKNFPSSTYGKAMRLKIYNDNEDAQVTIKGCEVRYRQESATPD